LTWCNKESKPKVEDTKPPFEEDTAESIVAKLMVSPAMFSSYDDAREFANKHFKEAVTYLDHEFMQEQAERIKNDKAASAVN
jgi:hypothetical protein